MATSGGFSGHRRHHPTPTSSTDVSTISFTQLNSPNNNNNYMSRKSTPRRRHFVPASTDVDKSWQGELSWQFEPTGWRDTNNLGAALGPWVASSSPAPSSLSTSHVFRRTAKDYYLSRSRPRPRRVSTDPYRDRSGYSVGDSLAGRVELQSFAGRGAENSIFFGDSFVPSETRGFPHREINDREAGDRIKGSLADKDELSFTKSYYDMLEHHSHEKSYVGDHKVSNDSEDEDDDDEVEAAKSVGLLSLFKYSTKMDFVLILLGCLGALINGGSLPWYSFLFGDFVNKIASDASQNDKNQMMRDVGRVWT